MLRYLRSEGAERPRAALFVDRDGVLNERVRGGYVLHPSELHLLGVALPALRLATRAQRPIVVVTNQGMIARGLATDTDLLAIHVHLLRCLEDEGIRVDGIFVCDHHPMAVDPALRVCGCRKPAPGLLRAAAVDLNLDLRSSMLIGDQVSDMEAAIAAGVSSDRALRLMDNSDLTEFSLKQKVLDWLAHQVPE